MAGQASTDIEKTDRDIYPCDVTGCFDMAEEVRRRWVSIAAYYIAQRRYFEQGAELDDWLEAERDFHLVG